MIAAFNNLKISAKVFGGFGAILVLLAGVSMIGVLSIGSVGDDFVRYRQVALQSNQAGRVQANLLEARVAVKDYLLTGNAQSAQRVKDRLAATSDRR